MRFGSLTVFAVALLCSCGDSTPAEAPTPDAGSDGVDVPVGTEPDGSKDASDAFVPPTDASDSPDSSDSSDSPDVLPADVEDGADSIDAADVPPPPPAVDLTISAFEALVEAGDVAGLEAFCAAYDMPICEGGTCLIVTKQPSGSSVQLLGEFNGWEGGLALTELASAPGTFYGTFEVTFSVVTTYKLTVDGEWTLDGSNRYFRFGGFGPDSAIYASGHSRLALIEGVWSDGLQNERSLYVYLPGPYFDPATGPLPVIYMQDGFNVFQNPGAPFGAWDVDLTADALIADGLAQPVIIVGIDTENRFDEYLHAPVALPGGATADPKLDLYGAFLVATVKPLIDATFDTLPEPDATCIAGSSLGGISSLWIGWMHAATIGRVASFSGSYWVGEVEGPGPTLKAIIQQNLEGNTPDGLTVYLDSGDTSFNGTASYSSDSWVYSDWTRNALISLGWAPRSEWDTDLDLATPPDDLAETTPLATVPSLAWSPTVPVGYSAWTEYLGSATSLLSLVGHGHAHNESAWKQRFGAALIFHFPGPAAGP